MFKQILASLSVAAVVAAPVVPPPVDGATAPLRIVAMGDSITEPCASTPTGGWCATLDQLLTEAGVPHVIIGEAVSGVGCGYWSDRIGSVLNADDPDLVLLNCGTNDDVNLPAARDRLGGQWRTIVEAVHGYGARIGVSFIGYSDPTSQHLAGRDWMMSSEALVNDTIYTNLGYYWNPGWLTGLVDFQKIPGNLDYLAQYGTGGVIDGIHPNQLGRQVMGVLWYRALRAGTVTGTSMPWPELAAAGQPCGLWGYRPGGSAPAGWVACSSKL